MNKTKFESNSGSLGRLRERSLRIGGKMSLTEKQSTVLRFIEDYIQEVGVPPTIREIGDYFTIGYRATQDHVRAIAKKGYLRLLPNVARGIVVLKSIKGENNE